MVDFKKLLTSDKNCLIIEVGSSNIKLGYFCYEDSKIVVKEIWVQDLTPLTEEEKYQKAISFVKSKFSLQQLKNTKIVFILPDKDYLVIRTTIPFIPKKEINQALQFTLKDEIAWDINNTFYHWRIVDERVTSSGDKQLDLVIASVQKSKINMILDACKKEQCVCYGVYTQFFAIADSFSDDSQDEAAVLDIGSSNTIFMIIKKDNPLFLRKIAFGSSQFTKSISSLYRAANVTMDSAEHLKKEYGFSGGDQKIHGDITASDLISCMRSDLEKLIYEINNSFEYYASKYNKNPIKTIYLLGAGSNIKKLDTILADSLELEVRAYPLPEDLTVSQGVKPVYLSSLASGFNAKQNNFLPKGKKPVEFGVFENLVIKFMIPLVVLTYLFLIVATGLKGAGYKDKIRKFEIHSDKLKKIKMLKEEMKRLHSNLDEMKLMYIPIDWVMKALSVSLPPEIVIKNLKIESFAQKVVIEGYVTESFNAEDVITNYALALRNIEIFKEVNVVNINKKEWGSSSDVEFFINCKLIKFE